MKTDKDNTFKIQMTVQEYAFLASVLPLRLSLHIQPRKRDQKKNNNKKQQEINPPLESESQMLKPQQTSKNNQKKAKVELIKESVKPCIKILQQLQSHKNAWPFLTPVDAQGLKIPEYREIVKDPMDMQTMESKLNAGKYQTPEQFHSDVIKIISNSYIFNESNEDFLKITNQFEKYYYRISGQTKPVVEKPSVVKANPQVKQISKNQKKKKKQLLKSRQFNQSQPITIEQKKQLAFNIHRLAKEHLRGVKNIVFGEGNEQTQFNIQKLSQKKIRDLQKYIRMKIVEMENNMRNGMLERNQIEDLERAESEMSQQFIRENNQL